MKKAVHFPAIPVIVSFASKENVSEIAGDALLPSNRNWRTLTEI